MSYCASVPSSVIFQKLVELQLEIERRVDDISIFYNEQKQILLFYKEVFWSYIYIARYDKTSAIMGNAVSSAYHKHYFDLFLLQI